MSQHPADPVSRLAHLVAGIAVSLVVLACETTASGTPHQGLESPGDTVATTTGAPTSSELDAARGQIVTTLDEAERLVARIREENAGDAGAAFADVVVLEDLVEEELDWLAAQVPVVTGDPLIERYRSALIAVAEAAAGATPEDPEPAELAASIDALLALRPTFAAES